jgi:hypothetical protein
MHMKMNSQKDFFSGAMFITVGSAFAIGSSNYAIGSGAKMGPGYFPLILGVLLTLLGAVIAVKALITPTEDGDKIGAFAWKPLFFIILANVVFGACIGGLPAVGLPPLGLIPGIFLLTAIAAYAGNDFRIKEVLVLAVILSVISYLAFIVLLKLQFPVWPAFIQG